MVESSDRGGNTTAPYLPVSGAFSWPASTCPLFETSGSLPLKRTLRVSLEHFGITTVEAMAAGCVPLVYDSGGQAEIVSSGYNGYRLFATLSF